MSNISAASLQGFHSVDLEANERIVLAHVDEHFKGEFTRAELNASLCRQIQRWAINLTTGRVNSLVKKGELCEDKSRTIKCKVGMSAHPIWRKSAAGQHGRFATTLPSQEGRAASVAPAAPLIAIVPYTGLQEQMSVQTAKRIINEDGERNYFYKQAQKRLRDISSRSSTDCVQIQADV